MDLRALIAESERLEREPIDDPVAPEVQVEAHSGADEIVEAAEESVATEHDDGTEAGPPDTTVEPVEDAVTPDMVVAADDEPEQPEVSVEDAGDAETPEVDVEAADDSASPDVAVEATEPEPAATPTDTAPAAETAEEVAEPAVEPVSEPESPDFQEQETDDDITEPSFETQPESNVAEPELSTPPVEEPDVPDDATPEQDTAAPEPTGLVAVNELPDQSESEYRQHESEMAGLSDRVGAQLEEQRRAGEEIAGQIVQSIGSHFDDIRDHLQQTTQDAMLTQQLLLTFLREA